MAMKTVYVETSVVSYLTAKPSSDLLAAAMQKVTVDWWDTHRSRFELFTSEVTVEEARKGNPEAAVRRLAALSGIPRLAVTDPVVRLSKALLQKGVLPQKALGDSLHIAVAAVHGLGYLLTWNCRHIDNAEIKPIVRKICALEGLMCPEICTPQELSGVVDDV